jgi:hypothetical protein
MMSVTTRNHRGEGTLLLALAAIIVMDLALFILAVQMIFH